MKPRRRKPHPPRRATIARIRDWQAPHDTPRPRHHGFEKLGDVVDRVKARVDRAIAERDEATGDAAHDDLIALEHARRLIKREGDA